MEGREGNEWDRAERGVRLGEIGCVGGAIFSLNYLRTVLFTTVADSLLEDMFSENDYRSSESKTTEGTMTTTTTRFR